MDTSSACDIETDHFPAARRSLRVAYVTETWPPEINGVALTAARMVQGLQHLNHEVQLVRPRQTALDAAGTGPRFHEVLMRGLPIPRYPHLRMGLPARRPLLALWQRQRPDVVHIATEGPLGWSALQAARHLRLPVTSDFRTNFHAYSRHYGVGWLRKPILAYLRKFHNRTLVTLVPTEPLRHELLQAGFRNVRVVARGVDTRRFSPDHRSADLRRSWGVGDDDLVVACVGRLAAEKNLDLLVSSFEAVARVRPDARLLLVGDGPLHADLQARLPRAILAGQRRDADLAAHYASADLFLFASLTETFGNVTAEALASGLPVVAFDYAAAAQLITSSLEGERVPFDDAAAFTRAAVALALDPPRRRAMGAQARQRALAVDWDSVIGRFESELLLAAAGPDRPAASTVPALAPLTQPPWP